MKKISVIAFFDDTLSLLIGYLLDNEIKIVHSKTLALTTDVISQGKIVSFSKAKLLLENLVNLNDQTWMLEGTINEVYLLLPTLPYQTRHERKEVPIISNNTVGPTERRALIQSFKNTLTNSELEIVEAIPYFYKIDNYQTFSTFPLGNKGNSLAANAFLYLTETKLISDCQELFRLVGLKIKRFLFKEIALAGFVKDLELPKGSFLLLTDQEQSSLSYLYDGNIVSSVFLNQGYQHFIATLGQSLKIDFDQVDSFLREYSFSNLGLNTDLPLEFSNIKLTQAELNRHLMAALMPLKDELLLKIQVLIKNVNARHPISPSSSTILLTGLLTKIRNLEKLFQEFNEVRVLRSIDLDPRLLTSKGMFYLSEVTNGNLSEFNEETIILRRINE